MNNIQTLKHNLYSLLILDYNINIYNESETTLILSFYHLNSIHNGLLFISKNDNYSNIDWQYHRKNKTVKQKLKNITQAIQNLYKNNHSDIIENEIAFYDNLAKMVYNAKYSYKTNVHTY